MRCTSSKRGRKAHIFDPLSNLPCCMQLLLNPQESEYMSRCRFLHIGYHMQPENNIFQMLVPISMLWFVQFTWMFNKQNVKLYTNRLFKQAPKSKVYEILKLYSSLSLNVFWMFVFKSSSKFWTKIKKKHLVNWFIDNWILVEVCEMQQNSWL